VYAAAAGRAPSLFPLQAADARKQPYRPPHRHVVGIRRQPDADQLRAAAIHVVLNVVKSDIRTM
jgi:hypothetical protein